MKINFLLITVLVIWISACRPREASDFSARLKDKLNFALDNFQSENKAFILNVLTPQQKTVFQILHTSYTQSTRRENDGFAFALQVTFPHNDTVALNRFKLTEYYPHFTHYKYLDVPCYVIDLDKDVAKIDSLAQRILNEVYQCKTVDSLSVEMTDEGSVKNWLR